MLKIALFALLSLPLLAGFFPKTVHTSIKSVEGKNITLKSAFPIQGMSGVVIHNYGNDLTAITHRITQPSKGKAQLISADVLHHDELPTIKTSAVAGDKVVGGYLYDNVLLLAPDADTAFGFNADSTMARYFISRGKLYLSKCSSNIGK